MTNVNELLKKKNELKAAAELLINNAMTTGNDLKGADLTAYDKHVADIKDIESLLQRHAQLATISTERIAENAIVVPGDDAPSVDVRGTKEFAKNFWAYMRGGVRNALSVGTDGVIVPTEFDKVLVEKLQNVNVMRTLASIITTQNDRKIAVENAIASADWAAEAAVSHNNDESDEPSYSQVTLSAYKLTRIEKVSEELAQDAFFDIQGYLARKFASAFGIAEEAAFVAGNGSGKPTGVVGSASAGNTTASGTAIVGDDLLACFHSLKRPYRVNGTWLMADSTALIIRKLKETTGQYIWQPGLQAGKPDTLLGKPVAISDSVPAVAVNNKAVLFGDFSYYTIADRSPRTFTRLNELYAANGQVGYRGVQRTDGKLTLAESIVAMVQAAS